MARVAIPLGLTPQATRPSAGERVTLSGPTMGVTWTVQAILPAGVDREAVRTVVQARLDGVVAQMSQWEPGSLLSRFNAAPGGTWMSLPDDFWAVLSHALDLASRSDGAFDPTLGRLVDLWGFGPGGARPAPSEAEIDAMEQGGWSSLPVDASTQRIRQPGGLHLDLSGIAKGYGVDAVAEVMAGIGAAYLVEIGGELRGAGVKPDGEPWWVEIETPPGLAVPLEPVRLALHGLSVATSGDYRRARVEGDRRIAHTLDPRTGRPLVDAPASVTVVHESCMQADALCTALTVMGPERGMAYAEHARVAAQIVSRDGQERLSSAFAAMLD